MPRRRSEPTPRPPHGCDRSRTAQLSHQRQHAVSVSEPLAPRDLFELAGREGEAFRRIFEGFASQSLQDFAGARFAGCASFLEIEECRAQALNGAFVLTRGDGSCRL